MTWKLANCSHISQFRVALNPNRPQMQRLSKNVGWMGWGPICTFIGHPGHNEDKGFASQYLLIFKIYVLIFFYHVDNADKVDNCWQLLTIVDNYWQCWLEGWGLICTFIGHLGHNGDKGFASQYLLIFVDIENVRFNILTMLTRLTIVDNCWQSLTIIDNFGWRAEASFAPLLDILNIMGTRVLPVNIFWYL